MYKPPDLPDAFHTFFKASLEESEIWLPTANTHKGQYAGANLSVDSVNIWSNLSPWESPHAECDDFKHLPSQSVVSEDPCRFSASLVHPASEIWLPAANTHKGQYARANLSVDSVYMV